MSGCCKCRPISVKRNLNLARSSATAKSTARPSCLVDVGLVGYFMTFLGRGSVDG